MNNGIFYLLDTSYDLFNKCKYERSIISDSKSDVYTIYQIFNLILSLNHLLEWYLGDSCFSNELKVKCLENFFPYKIWTPSKECKSKKNLKSNNIINSIITSMNLDASIFQVNEDQYLLRKVSNQIKHIKFNKIETSMATSFTVQCGEIDSYCDYTNQAGDYKYLFYINDDGKDIDLLKLIDRFTAVP